MPDRSKRIEQLEIEAATAELIGNLAIDDKTRKHNKRHAVEAAAEAERLKKQDTSEK